MKEITKIEGKSVCEDWHCVMFKKTYHSVSMADGMTGWGCPECHTTRWDKESDGHRIG